MKKSETVDQLPLSGAVNADGRSTTTTRHLRLYCLPALRCAFHQSRYAASFSFHSSSCYGVTSFPDRELKWLALSGRTTASHLLPLLLLLLLQHPTASVLLFIASSCAPLSNVSSSYYYQQRLSNRDRPDFFFFFSDRTIVAHKCPVGPSEYC